MEIILGFIILVILMAVITAIIIMGEINSQDREELEKHSSQKKSW